MNSANAENLPVVSASAEAGNDSFLQKLQVSSSVFAVVGGVLLASNTEVSKYGFILLAMSSGQMVCTSLMTNNKSLLVYAVSVFCFVDCLGVYRWLIQ